MRNSTNFYLTKVREGKSNNLRIDTNVERIFKFLDAAADIGESDVFGLSPENLRIGLTSIEPYTSSETGTIVAETLLTNEDFIVEIKFFSNTGEINIGNIKNYLTKEANFYYSLNLKGIYDSNESFLDSFKNEWSSIWITAVLEQAVSKTIAVFVGNKEDALRVEELLHKFSLWINDLSWSFSADGMVLKNTALTIKNNGLETVFYADDYGNLCLKGKIYATDGEFKGTVYATDGEFTGTIHAGSGEIGGFTIDDNNIYFPGPNKNNPLANSPLRLSSNDYGESRIYVLNINIGTGAVIDKYLRLGNLKLWNPEVESTDNPNSNVIELKLSLYVLKGDQDDENSDFEQGGLSDSAGSRGANLNSNTRIKTKGFILVNPGLLYSFVIDPIEINDKTIKKIICYYDEGKNDYLHEVTNASDNVTINSKAKYIRIVLYKDGTIWNSTDTSDFIIPQDIKEFTISGDTNYFTLTNNGYIEGNNWYIKKVPGYGGITAKFGRVVAEDGVFNGIIRARDGVFTGEVTASVINATTLNTVNFVTEKVRAMGGSFIFKPSTNVEEVDEVICNNLLTDSSFATGEKVLFKTGAKWKTSSLWNSSSSTYRIEEKPISDKNGNYTNFIYKCKNDSEKGWNAIGGAIYLDIYETVKNDDFLTLEYTLSGDFCFDNVSADETPTGWTNKGIRLRIWVGNDNEGKVILNKNYSIEQLEKWDEWQTLIFTNLKVPDGITINKFYVYIYSVGADIEVKVRNLKIERGNNTTPKWTPSLEEVGVNSNGTEIINYLDSEGNIVLMTPGGSGTVTYNNNNHTFTVSGSTGYPCVMKTLALKRKTQYTFKILVVNFTSGGSLPCIGIDKYPITGSAKLMKYSTTIEDNIITLIYTPNEDGNHRLRIFSNCRDYTSGATIPNTSVTYSNLTCAVNYKTFLRLKYNNENDFNSYLLSYGDNPVVALSNESITYGLLLGTYNNADHYAYVDVPNNESYNNILNSGCYSITIFGTPGQDEIIAINSDNTKAGNIIPERALVMLKFGLLLGNGSLSNINVNLLLGDLSLLASTITGNEANLTGEELKYITGYGLYADNVFLRGSLMTATKDKTCAGVNTLRNLSFNYNTWNSIKANLNQDYSGEKIVFWGGANSLDERDVLESPFIVTDKGSIFASRGVFKGAVLSDSLITNTIIKTPVLYGTGNEPSLKIYDTNSTKGGIVFYRLVNSIDAEANEKNDRPTLSITTRGFTHYHYANGNSSTTDTDHKTNFIDFFEHNGSGNDQERINFKGTHLFLKQSYDVVNPDKYYTSFSESLILDVRNGAAAEILFKGESDGVNEGVRLKYGDTSLLVFDREIYNYTDFMATLGEFKITKKIGDKNNKRSLDYRISNGYYCLYVNLS